MFRFPNAKLQDPAVDAWLAARSDPVGLLAREWVSELRRCGQDVRELIHDGCPVACVGEVAFAYVDSFKSHVNVGFFEGASLDDPEGLLVGDGKRMRHVKLKPGTSDTSALRRLVEDAYADMQRRLA